MRTLLVLALLVTACDSGQVTIDDDPFVDDTRPTVDETDTDTAPVPNDTAPADTGTTQEDTAAPCSPTLWVEGDAVQMQICAPSSDVEVLFLDEEGAPLTASSVVYEAATDLWSVDIPANAVWVAAWFGHADGTETCLPTPDACSQFGALSSL